MRKQKILFNYLLLKYNKYKAKLNRFQLTGRNIHRQAVLKKHIDRLQNKLSDLYTNINLKKMTSVAMLTASMMMITPEANAQNNFGAPQTNPFGLISTYYISTPSLVDLDGDGDFDILSGEYYGNFIYQENIGTATSPTYGPTQSNPFGLTNNPYLGLPSFADIDGDGDLDMLTGDSYGNFKYYENNGSPTSPSFMTPVANPFSLTALSYSPIPSFADLDGDGDFDIITGEYYGDLLYFENLGTPTAPSYASAQTNPFGLSAGVYAIQTDIVDLDNDGDFDIVIGGYYGNFYYLKNTGTSTSPSFDPPIMNPYNLSTIGVNYSSPSFADLDQDGDIDLISGSNGGDFYYFENSPSLDTIVELNTNSLTVNEGDASFDIPLNYQVANSDPSHTVDLQILTGDLADIGGFSTMTATFNTTTEKFTVNITDDAFVEATETLSFALVNATNGLVIGADSIFTLNIQDNDGMSADTLVELSTNTATLNETDGSFDIALDYQASATNPLHSVDLQLISGDASDIDNFTTTTATFNTTTEKFTVNITDDAIVETNEVLSFALVNASNGLKIGADSIFTLSIEDNDVDAIEEINLNDLRVYPNPSSDKVIVALNSNENQMLTISILDLIGKEIISQNHFLFNGENTIPIDITKLATGNYFISIKTKKGIHKENFLVK